MLIGLTGGIGSGKSTVAKVFEAMGCMLYDSDEQARRMYFNGAVKPRVIALLGADAYLSDEEINRPYIASKVFHNAALLEQLNGIIHPALKDDLVKFRAMYESQYILVKETALLFEAHVDKDVDASVLVVAPTDLKIRRVMQRNGMSREEVLQRMRNQWSDERKLELATHVIYNDEQHAVIPQVQKILQQYHS